MTKDKRYLRKLFSTLEHDDVLVQSKEYKNYKGEVALRHFIPVNIRFDEYNEWHGNNVWILEVWDMDKKDFRDFCLNDLKG